jgi:hypothetical protein
MTTTTGTDVLRKALKARNLAVLGKELSVPKHVLEEFMWGKRDIPPALKVSLTEYIFGGAITFDNTIDRLRSSNRTEPTPLGVKPPPCVRSNVKYVVGGMNGIGPQPVKPVKALPKVPRLGWVE